MREKICPNCGYRKAEGDMMDYMAQMPMYPNFMVNNVLPYMNLGLYEGGMTNCPRCGKKI